MAEHQIVDLGVVGSSPIKRPKCDGLWRILQRPFRFCNQYTF
jgi:hypothetical protein